MNMWEVKEGVQQQLEDEEKAYQITATPVGSTPTAISVAAYDEGTDEDVTATVYPTNSPSAVGDVITLSLLKNLTVGHAYRIEVIFTADDGNTWKRIIKVNCPQL